MAGPLTELWRFQRKVFARYKYELKRILKTRLRGFANESDDAGALSPDWSIAKLLASARALLAAHIARRDNPHQETMNTIGSYTAATVNDKIDDKMPLAIMPFSSYAVRELLSRQQLEALWSSNGFSLTCSQAMNVILSGTPYVLPAKTLNLASVVPDPSNKTFNVFVRLRFGVIDYMAREDSPPESISIMWIGKVVTNATGIVSREFYPVTRVDTFRISDEPLGSVIPVAKGVIDEPVKFPSSWNPL